MSILDWLDTANEYSDLIKTGVAAASTYASYQDQKKKNEMQQRAYDDYMKQVNEAGKEARAAIDINYTPMTVSGVPTTKADVTDFTAVAAKGGLMSIPNRQRKRYARGPEEAEVMEMDEEVITPEGFKMETGVDVTGEQVFYNTGRGDRANAMMIWDQMDSSDKMPFDFDFEIFFLDGGWRDMIKGEGPAVQGETQMASHAGNDAFLENRYQELLELGLSPAEAAAQAEKELSSGNVPGPMAIGGIAGLRNGGRPGYNIGDVVTADAEAVVSDVPQSQVNQIQGSQMSEQAYNEIFRKFMERFPNMDTDNMTLADMIAMLQAEGVMEQDLGILGLDRAMGMITPQSAEKSAQRISMGDTQWGNIPYAKGGRTGFYRGSDRGDFSLSELLNPRDPQNELIAEHMQIGKLPHNITARILELNRGGKSYEDIAEITGVNIEDITSILEVANNPQIIDPVDKQGKVDYDIWDDIMAENISIRERPEHLSYNAKGGRIGYKLGTPDTDVEIMDEEFVGDNELKMEEGVQIGPMAGGGERGWKAQEIAMDWAYDRYGKDFYDLSHELQMQLYGEALDFVDSGGMKKGGRVKRDNGGIMNLGGLEKDYRTTGGFVPIGAYEKKDDVPARLSKNEFVFTADAVRAAGGGSINKGAQRMYDTMKHLEAQPTAQRMTA